jgi:hypothetical protein
MTRLPRNFSGGGLIKRLERLGYCSAGKVEAISG